MDFTAVAWSLLLRTGQLLADASSTIVCGVIVAGVMRAMVGPVGVRKVFGGRGLSGYFRSWVMGMLLPVCSIGVIPIAREMRRCGMAVGNILSFVLAAPLLNPISFLYGLTLAEPVVILCFALASLLLALAAGEVWEYLLPSRVIDTSGVDQEPLPAPGLKRLLAVLVHAARESVGPMLLYGVVGLIVAGLLSVLIPFGALQNSMSHYRQPWSSPPLMVVIALPSYASPLNGMMKLGLMFEHGNSIGAAFVLFVLGIGANVGLVLWLGRQFGWKLVLAWFGMLSAAVILLGYLGEHTLYRSGIQEVEHTHAFDDWSAPFPEGTAVSRELILAKLGEKYQGLELFGTLAFLALILLGVLDRRLGRQADLDAFLLSRGPASDKPQPWWNRPIPGPILGVIVLVGLVVFSVLGAYIYYPPPDQVLSEMHSVQAELFSATAGKVNHEEAIRRIEHWDLLTRKLQVGVYIRRGRLREEQARAAEELRENLEEMRDLLRDRSSQAAEKTAEACGMLRGEGKVRLAFMECERQFKEP